MATLFATKNSKKKVTIREELLTDGAGKVKLLLVVALAAAMRWKKRKKMGGGEEEKLIFHQLWANISPPLGHGIHSYIIGSGRGTLYLFLGQILALDSAGKDPTVSLKLSSWPEKVVAERLARLAILRRRSDRCGVNGSERIILGCS